jgi:hypothetical protein
VINGKGFVHRLESPKPRSSPWSLNDQYMFHKPHNSAMSLLSSLAISLFFLQPLNYFLPFTIHTPLICLVHFHSTESRSTFAEFLSFQSDQKVAARMERHSLVTDEVSWLPVHLRPLNPRCSIGTWSSEEVLTRSYRFDVGTMCQRNGMEISRIDILWKLCAGVCGSFVMRRPITHQRFWLKYNK